MNTLAKQRSKRLRHPGGFSPNCLPRAVATGLEFPSETSLKINLSIDSSATTRLSRAFSDSKSFSRFGTPKRTRQVRLGANAVSDAAGEPRCDLLDQPRIAVGIIEGEERPVARALGVGAGKPCLRGARRAVPHFTRVDATADEFVMSRCDVGDNQRARG